MEHAGLLGDQFLAAVIGSTRRAPFALDMMIVAQRGCHWTTAASSLFGTPCR